MQSVVETPGYLKDAEAIFTAQERAAIVTMSAKAFGKIMRGIGEVKAYTEGEREGFKVTVPPSVDVKRIRKGLNMTQAAFSNSFGFSLDAVKHWEGGRRTPEVPARAYLTVIQRNPTAVLEALHPASTTNEHAEIKAG